MKSRGNRRQWPAIALVVTSVLLAAACDSPGAATGGATPSHALAVTVGAPQPLTFYEGEDDTEPLTPFYVSRGSNGTANAIGYVPNEGGYYLDVYDATSWQEKFIANGFEPSDPLWDCDQSFSNEIAMNGDSSLLARSCDDGSLTVYTLPISVPVFHTVISSSNTVVAARAPVVAFAPSPRNLVAITDDGPGGPGTRIQLLSSSSWQAQATIPVSAGLLSQPSWSPDGSRIAAVDLAGMLHIWSATNGNEIAGALLPHFAAGYAGTDPSGPAPQWSPDGSHLYVTAPTARDSTMIAAYALNAGGQLTPRRDDHPGGAA